MKLFLHGNPTEEEIKVGVKITQGAKNQKFMILAPNEAAYYNYHKDYKNTGNVNWSFFIQDRLKNMKNSNSTATAYST